MQKLTISLLKQFTLLAALGFTTSFLFLATPSGNTLFVLQLILGLLYLVFSVAEFSTQTAKLNLPLDRFFYLPYEVISDKVIRLGAFAIAAGVLWISGSGWMFLAMLLSIIVVSDLLVFGLKINKKIYFISLSADYVLVSLEHEQKIITSTIESIEYRYDIFYLKLKNKKTVSLVTDRLAENQKQIFTKKFVQWALQNQLEFTEEAKQKLKAINV